MKNIIICLWLGIFLCLLAGWAHGRDKNFELLLLKLIQENKNRRPAVIPVPIYIPKCNKEKSHHYPVYVPTAKKCGHGGKKYPLFVPIHQHNHHLIEEDAMPEPYDARSASSLYIQRL